MFNKLRINNTHIYDYYIKININIHLSLIEIITLKNTTISVICYLNSL